MEKSSQKRKRVATVKLPYSSKTTGHYIKVTSSDKFKPIKHEELRHGPHPIRSGRTGMARHLQTQPLLS